VSEVGPGEGEHQRLADLWKSRPGQICFDPSCVLIVGAHVFAKQIGANRLNQALIKFEPACFQARCIASDSSKRCNRPYESVSERRKSRKAVLQGLKLIEERG
jgi:hypothetical protein